MRQKTCREASICKNRNTYSRVTIQHCSTIPKRIAGKWCTKEVLAKKYTLLLESSKRDSDRGIFHITGNTSMETKTMIILSDKGLGMATVELLLFDIFQSPQHISNRLTWIKRSWFGRTMALLARIWWWFRCLNYTSQCRFERKLFYTIAIEIVCCDIRWRNLHIYFLFFIRYFTFSGFISNTN